ncbi:2-dehydropantoate 2-reductase [Raineyella fluvialis]|uniref:2-dehydropantoate 2-reductase n=1 Tax=Raineyella fluvialis TaxID=2662261 RepID=A0A5Q2FAD8_9ACTN|nr:2-dehydropantoate 2-reductase [Raineyella fluvialis]QGF23341.1 2-dehydropantoate 2-reductase [Raineyella fluvialis]
MMRFAVIGAGGLGGFFGGLLANGGHEVHFVVRGRTLAALLDTGLSITGGFRAHLDRVEATDDARTIGHVDVVLVTVKAGQLPDIATQLPPLVGPQTIVLTMQNGVEAPDTVAEVVGREHVVPCVVRIFTQLEEPGRISHHGGAGSVTFGAWDNVETPLIEATRAAFEGVGISAPEPPDIWVDLWTKAMFIIPTGALGTLSGQPMGEVRTALRDELSACIAEIEAIARARGVRLPPDAVERTLAFVDEQPADATTSLQRDLMHGRASELDSQAGAVVRLGRQVGVPTPRHDLMYAVLSLRERAARG